MSESPPSNPTAIFENGENHVDLHDLRFVEDGDTAQIDHHVLATKKCQRLAKPQHQV